MDEEKLLQVEKAVKSYLTAEANERYCNIRVAHPELAVQVLAVIAQAVQENKVKSMIDDQSLKEILRQVSQKHQGKIIRK